jgi:hypothetical protein
MGKYKGITNDWNYDASCTLTSLPISNLDNFKGLIFVAQSVQEDWGGSVLWIVVSWVHSVDSELFNYLNMK